ncbi:MAG: agmatinase [Planctomycetes bacterium]|nr:agmatinase [Planctomycetota bacterium]
MDQRGGRGGPDPLSAARHAPDNFGQLEAEWSTYERSRFVVLPLPFERTTTFQKGTERGPAAAIRCTVNMELYDEATGLEPYLLGIHTAPPITADEDPGAFADRVEPIYRLYARDGKFVVVLGGEHSVSLAPIRVQASLHPGLSVLQVDAHPDLRDAYEGTRYGHGCVMRRVLEHCPVVQVGIRSVSREEAEFIEGHPRVTTFLDRDTHRDFEGHIPQVLEALGDPVYVSIDVDGLDPSLVPGTGTPEPGGLGWHQVSDLLEAVFDTKEVVACDVVEIRPLEGNAVSEYTAARLAHRMMALWARRAAVPAPVPPGAGSLQVGP